MLLVEPTRKQWADRSTEHPGKSSSVLSLAIPLSLVTAQSQASIRKPSFSKFRSFSLRINCEACS